MARQAIASLLQPIGSAPQRQRYPVVAGSEQQLSSLEQLARGCLTEDWEGQGKAVATSACSTYRAARDCVFAEQPYKKSPIAGLQHLS